MVPEILYTPATAAEHPKNSRVPPKQGPASASTHHTHRLRPAKKINQTEQSNEPATTKPNKATNPQQPTHTSPRPPTPNFEGDHRAPHHLPDHPPLTYKGGKQACLKTKKKRQAAKHVNSIFLSNTSHDRRSNDNTKCGHRESKPSAKPVNLDDT